MFGRTAGRPSTRRRLRAALGSALILSTLSGTFVPVAAAGPLSITNADSPDPVRSGSQILYTVVVTNTGGAKVNNVVLTDQVNGVVGFGNPPLLDVVSTRGSCTQTNTQVTCNAGSIEGFGSWTVTIRGIVTAATGTTINNIATVVATKSAQTYTTSASATTQVEGTGPGGASPDLTIGKNGPLSVTPGTGITYTLTVNNVGTANALGVKVTDTIPAEITPVSVSATSLFACGVSGQTVTCADGRVNAGSNATITVNGTVQAAAAGTLENTSVVDPDNTIDEGELGNTADAAELNNFSNTVVTDVTPVPPPPPAGYPISLDKQGPASAIPNELIQYTLVVQNGSLGRADYITLTDGTQGLQAASLRVISAQATSGTTPKCVVTAPTVECTMTRLATGGTLTVVIEGMVVAPAGSTIINSAAVNANVKNKGYTSRDEVQTIINAGRDLTISKADAPDPVCARSWPDGANTADCRGGLHYTFVVGNSGVQDATNVVVRDPLPPGTTYDDAASSPLCDEIPAGIVTCTIPTLGAGASETIEIVLVAPPTLGTITNTVTVDPSNAIFEADETNNIAVATTTVATGIDLTIVKDDSPPASPDGFDPIATSGTQTYRIVVDNTGTQDATGIQVRDILPSGTIFLTAEEIDLNGPGTFPDLHGFTCTHNGAATGGQVDCVGGSLLGSASELYYPPAPGDDKAYIEIKVFARPTVGTMHNEVRVDPLDQVVEYDEADNIEFEDTSVVTGNDGLGAFNQLTITKSQYSPAGDVATNGTLIYDLEVANLGTDPVSSIVVKDFLPAGSRFIEAKDTDVGSGVADAFFCAHDGQPFGGTVTCTGGDLSGTVNKIVDTPGPADVPTVRNIRIKVYAPNTPGIYPNSAVVDPSNVVPEGNEFDNDSQITTTVAIGAANEFNELTIAKTQTDPAGNAVATSSIVTWDILVSNSGSDPAFNVRVTDALPSGFTLVSALDTSGPSDPFRFVCSAGASNTVDCTGATLSGTVNAAGTNPTTRTIQLRAFSSPIPGTYTNTVIVDPANAIPEGNETNNTASASVVASNGGPGAFIDLQIDKQALIPAAGTPVAPGGQLAYTLTVTNSGAADAFNVAVRDVLPSHTTFFNAADGTVGPGMFTCAQASGAVNCTGGYVPAGGSRTILVLMIAPTSIEEYATDLSNISIGITNQAFVDPDDTIQEGNEVNNADSVDTTVTPPINLKLDKQGPGSATQNDTTTYTITVTNEKVGAGATAFGVKIVDPLPIGLLPLSVTAEPGNFTCQFEENPVNFVTCLGDLKTTEQVVITIEAFVTQDGGTLDNEACVDPDHVIAETNELDNCKHAIGTVSPPAPDLLINKTASSGSVTSGEELVYTLTVSNVGTGDTTDTVTVLDTVPSDVTVTEIAPDGGWTCLPLVPGSNVVSCTRPDLAKGESSHITVRTTAGATLTSPFTNTAMVLGGGDLQLNNNSDSVTTSVGGAAIDLTVTSITDTPDPVNRSSQLTYTIVARNDGTSGASPDAVVRVELPDTGVSPQGVSGTNGFNCSANLTVDAAGKTFDCVGDFAASGSPGDSVTITAIVTVDPGAPNDLKITVTADPGNAFGESNETNNSLSETTTVSGTVCTSSPCVDLVVADVFDSPDPVTAGNDFTYVVSIVNVGDAPVDPTAIWDIHFQYFGSGSPTLSLLPDVACAVQPGVHHVHCTSTAGTDGMDLGPGEGLTFTITVSGATAGSASLNVQADFPSAAIAEFSESNNNVTETTTIVDP